MMDYMLPRKVMSWKEAFELYFEQQMLNGLFPDLEYYGIRPPRHVDQAIAEKDHVSHQVYWILYQFSLAANFNTTVPTEELDWMSQVYPDTFDQHYRPLWERAGACGVGNRFFFRGLPMLCQVCQIPMAFTEPGDPSTNWVRTQRVPRRAVQLLLRRLQVDLRPGAGEVRAGLAAGAPDLPGQLRRDDDARGARLVRHRGRRRQRRVPDVAATRSPGTSGTPRAVVGGVGDGRQGALRLRLPVEGPAGGLRRRHAGQRHVDEQHAVRLGGLLPRAEGDVLGASSST